MQARRRVQPEMARSTNHEAQRDFVVYHLEDRVLIHGNHTVVFR